jgi:hypothetical protein
MLKRANALAYFGIVGEEKSLIELNFFVVFDKLSATGRENLIKIRVFHSRVGSWP